MSIIRRFVIVGAGGVGSVLGGYLTRAGEEVCLVSRPAHVRAIVERGLTIVEAGASRVTVHPEAVSKVTQVKFTLGDCVMLACKAYDTAGSLRQVRRASRIDPAAVVCLQNGVRNEEVASRVFPAVYGAMLRFPARLLEPGVAVAPGDHSFVLGHYPAGQDSTVREIARRCSVAGVQSSVSNNVMRHKWSKLVLNCANAVYAITDRGAESFGTDHALRLATDLVIDEASAALRVAGIPHYRSRPSFRASVGGYPHRSSTWVDFLRRRGKSEVPWLNGEIVSLGRRFGFPTPVNSLLLEISDQMVHSGAVPGRYTTTELLELMRDREAQAGLQRSHVDISG